VETEKSKVQKFKDWFGRKSSDSFTFRNDENKMVNWESGYENYSDFLLGSANTPAESANLLYSMFKMMGVNKKTKLSNKLDPGTGTIMLPTDLLDDKKHGELPKGVRSDAFLGGAIRNAAISAFESERNANAIQSVRYEVAREDSKSSDPTTKITGLFQTVLHDERTDRKVAEKFPGYSRFISKYKEYKFNNSYEKQEFENDYQEFMDLVLRMIQFPGSVEDELVDKYASHINDVRDIMDTYGGIPDTFKDTELLGSRLAQYVLNMVPPSPPPPPDGGGGEGEGEGDGSGTPPPGGAPPMTAEEKAESLVKAAKEYAESMLTEKDGSSKDEMMDAVDQVIEDAGAGQEEGASDKKTYFKVVEDDKHAYMTARDSVDRAKANTVANLLKRKARDFKFSIKGMRSGRLDTNKLVEARQHVPTVYERMGEVKTDKLAVCILIDESGSMSGSKIDKARQAAIFLNEAFGSQPDVELYIYGHTADHNHSESTEIMVYREPGVRNKYNLGNVRARSNNRDGHAIFQVGKRVRKFSKNPVVMIVISDGQPAASDYGGTQGMEHTRKMVLKTEGLGMQVIQVAIDSVSSEKMFKNYIKMTKMSTFPNDLVNFLRVRVNKNIKEHVTVS
jgi:Mg-chelatase subunit ChlD